MEFNLSEKIYSWKNKSIKEFKEQKDYRVNHLKSNVKGNYEVELEHRIKTLERIEQYIKEFIKLLKEFMINKKVNANKIMEKPHIMFDLMIEEIDELAGDKLNGNKES